MPSLRNRLNTPALTGFDLGKRVTRVCENGGRHLGTDFRQLLLSEWSYGT
jgi:hypothetical protein